MTKGARKSNRTLLNEKDLAELWEPFQALRGLYNLPHDKMVQANDSLMADLLGEDPKAAPRSDLEPETLNLAYAIMHAYSPINRFDVYKTMFGHYPWRSKISKSDHFECAYHLFAHECYIFEERLKKLLGAMKKYAQRHNININFKTLTHDVIKLHGKVFDSILRSRGTHVHQEDFAPREIKRISLLALMQIGPHDGNPVHLWAMLEAQAISQARKQWKVRCEDAKYAAQKILLFVFRSTKPVWSSVESRTLRRNIASP